MAEQKGTGRIVAIKKIKSKRVEEGVNFTAVREIKLLREFKHENIIELVDCFTTPDQAICLVYECAYTDLEKILNNKAIPISLADMKQHLLSLLSAISACHDRWILHVSGVCLLLLLLFFTTIRNHQLDCFFLLCTH
jgi:cyclin-dependent kinase 7